MSGAGLETTVAERLVCGDPETVFAAVSDLADRLWSGCVDIVVSVPPTQLVHTVRVDPDSEDVAAWLTWDLTSALSGARTKVRLVQDEADTSAGPAPELDAVLELLVLGFTGSPHFELQ